MTNAHGDTRQVRPSLQGRSILYFIDASYYGGAERYLLWTAEGAAREGARVRFLLRRGGSLGPLRNELRRLEMAIDELPLDLPQRPAGLPRLFRYLARHRADILHANLPAPYLAQNSLVAPVARSVGFPAVVTTEHLPRLPTSARRALLKRFCTYFVDRVITVSRANARNLERLHRVSPQKIRVIVNGAPEPEPIERAAARKDLEIRDDEFFLCLVGELSPRKGQMLLLNAMARLHLREGWRLWLVGEGPDRYILEQRAEELGLEERVRLTGFRGDVAVILAASDLLVLPSNLEGMPYVILEAMSLGIPVVATTVDGIPEIVLPEVTGLLVPPDDEEALCGAIRRCMENPELARAWGEAGRARYREGFTLDRSVAKTLRLYRELLG